MSIAHQLVASVDRLAPAGAVPPAEPGRLRADSLRYDARRMVGIRKLLLGYPNAYRLARRAFVLGRFAARRPHDVDFAAFGVLPGDGLFLDVGANAGTSAMSFRLYKRRNPILSIEPSSMHTADLLMTSWLVRRMNWMLCAAGEAPGVMTLHVPCYGGVTLSEYAALDPAEADFDSYNVQKCLGPDADRTRFELLRQQTPIVRLDDLELSPSFIKIDTQGFEMKVLRGLQRTLDKHRPVLLIEVGGDWDMIDVIRQKRYHAFCYEGGALRPFVAQNVANLFMLPDEHPFVDAL